MQPLQKLSPQRRPVIALKKLEDFQHHEIAEVLNLSLST